MSHTALATPAVRVRRSASRRVPLSCAFALVVAVAASCGGEQRTPRDSAAAAAPAPPPTAATADSGAGSTSAASRPTPAPENTCPLEGEWRTCKVEKRLTDAGYRPVHDGAAPGGVFPVEGARYTLGAAELYVYVFPSARDRERAVAAIDTVTVARAGAAGPWKVAPTLITSNNLAAVLVSDNGRLIERVQDALTAGLPSATR